VGSGVSLTAVIEAVWCKPTMNCDDDHLCHKLCCSDSDCTGTAKTCKPINSTVVGTFGLCY